MDHSAALESMHRFVHGMNAHFANRFFIVDGTLLGLVRHGGFVPGDNDIDFGMWIEDYDPRLIDDLKAAGFVHFRTWGSVEDGLGLQFRDGDIRYDILFFYRHTQGIWSAVYTTTLQLRASYPMFGTEPATFLGIGVMMPSPPELYLETAYGADWRQPVTAWDYRYAPIHLRPIGPFRWRLRYAFKKAIWRLRHRDVRVRPV